MVRTDRTWPEPLFPMKVKPKDLEKQRQEETAAKGQTPEPKGWATHGSSLDQGKEEETPNARQTIASCKGANGRQDLLIFLHTAIQYSSDSKLFLLPPQPPYIKRTHFLLLESKYQRGITARQGPVIASWEQTAVWRWGRTWAGEEHRPCRATYNTVVALVHTSFCTSGLSVATSAPHQRASVSLRGILNIWQVLATRTARERLHVSLCSKLPKPESQHAAFICKSNFTSVALGTARIYFADARVMYWVSQR